jgi:hypothetical protein
MTHEAGLAIAERTGYQFYDALIIAAALEAHCVSCTCRSVMAAHRTAPAAWPDARWKLERDHPRCRRSDLVWGSLTLVSVGNAVVGFSVPRDHFSAAAQN